MTSKEIQMINELGDFIHRAFCVEGDTKFLKTIDPSKEWACRGIMFEVTDKKRGLFYIAMYHPEPNQATNE
jgi:hypothetical protein